MAGVCPTDAYKVRTNGPLHAHFMLRMHRYSVTITRRGKPVGVLVSPGEFERLRQVQAYLDMLRLSRSLQDSEVSADELYEASREELEARS